MYALEGMLLNYATKQSLDEIRTDIEGKASIEQINIMSNENATIKKDVGKFATSNEMRSRFDVITKDMTKKMMDRITKEEFKK